MHTANPNRLAQATSPYLLQHADNPVDWWPWCDEALQLARREQRPILLSIGYSACHWCHVMAHESFEDPETAALMNRLYVNIKVDREERPDLDKIYQTAHQLLARRPGGWPLTVFLTPDDQAPFFAGTYFPPSPRHGLPAFRDLLERVHNAYLEQPDAIREQNSALVQALQQLEPNASGGGALSAGPLEHAAQQFAGSFDAAHGGFGQAPKFPHPSSLALLLARWQATGDARLRDMLLLSLERMALGGMNDQLGGGFCRYSVDAEWMIPHFEKMLYDNGPLLALYADAWRATDGRPLFAHVCRRTAEWVLREMQAPAGGYYSSLDADSEGEEGRYYVWDRDQVAGLLSPEEYRVFAPRYGLDHPPNFEGRWHLHTYTDTAALQQATGLGARAVRRLLASARDKLLAARAQRLRPGRDEKILTSWNALMIRGLARAGRLLGEPEWLASAERARDYLHARHWRDGRLLATSKDGQAHLAAYLDDYAYLLDALLELLQARWRNADLDWAIALADCLLEHFADPVAGGFYFTADDHERLLHRPKPWADDATPAGNGVAALALQRLGHLLGEPRYLAAAERTLQAGWPAIERLPYAHPSLLLALAEQLEPSETLVIRAAGPTLGDWQELAARHWRPDRSCYAIPAEVADLPGLLAQRPPADGPIAYLCQGTSCLAPIRDLAALGQTLAASGQ
ncbi:MAG: hypothetical protein RLZ44_1084 [Pseudomonadota bacterium]